LQHYNHDRPAIVEPDALDFAMQAILLQKFADSKIHPHMVISKKFSPAKMNIEIYNKDPLVIIYAMKIWHIYLYGAQHTYNVFSNHMNL
jgi:hypothetical protein